jgi:coenzyme F420-reducing hydrogenase beta subunit
MLDNIKTGLCVGCTKCYSVCPASAITMGENSRGFYVPVINFEKCNSCKRCERVCPMISEQDIIRDVHQTECFYGFTKDEDSLMKSTSGGVFYELACNMLERGGIVCGCIWDDEYIAIHVCTDDMNTVKKMRGSKYVQSNLGTCFKQIKRILTNRPVFFTGTPCQTTALHQYIGKSDNLLTCALICGGVPSPKIWQLYKHALENKAGGKLVNLSMRSKKEKWLVPQMTAKFKNGRAIHEVLTYNLYGANFSSGLTIANPCMECRFKLDVMEADLLIGDHWGITPEMLNKCHNRGASCILPLTPKGKLMIEQIDANMHIEKGSVQNVIDSHFVLMKNHIRNPFRDEFFDKIELGEDILNLFRQYIIKEKDISSFYKIILHKLRLYIPLYTLRWKMQNRNKR